MKSAMSKRRAICGIIVWILLLLYGHEARCADSDPKAFIHDVNTLLVDPVPGLSSVVPGYSRPKKAAPGLVVAALTGDHEDQMPWGDAIGRILRRKIMSIPNIYLRTPDPKVVRVDGWKPGMSPQDELRSMESIRLVGQRLGIENALMGSIKVNGDRYEMDLQLVSLPSAKVQKTFHYSGNNEDIPSTLSKAALQVYSVLGVKLDKKSQDYLSLRTPATSGEIEKFVRVLVELNNKRGKEALEAVKPFIDNRVFLSAVVPLYFSYLEPDTDLRAYLKHLDEVAGIFPSDAGIELLVVSLVGHKASGSLRQSMINRVQKIVAENPQDPTAMLVLIDLLTADNRYLEAIAVCEEALDRWPNNYRVWWSMAYTLNGYAGDVRGMKLWKDVPQKGKRLWRPLKDLAYRAVNRALESNTAVPELWVQKMYAIADYSPETMQAFHKAIELDPHNKRAYAAALNFTLPQWGGSYEAQQEVWELALKNNPDRPSWLDEIRKEYMKELPSAY
jgi:tetratricopeptide (TPR) repeat protein